jgi:hypothetical protein
MRRLDQTPIDPEIAAALDALDATLAGEPVDPRHAELAELALLLAQERPTPSPAFAERLGERVESRFARGAQTASRGAQTASSGQLETGAPRWRGWLLGGGATVATLAATVLLVVGLGGHSASSSSSSSAAGGGGGTVSATSSSASPQRSAAQPAANGSATSAAPSALQPPPNGRKITQSAQLALTTASSRIESVAQEAFNVVGQQHGFIQHSSVTQAGGSSGYAFMTLSVPSSSLSQTMSMLSALQYAQVASRTDNVQDVNNQYNQDTRRLADARALHTSLLKQLADATTTQQIDSIQAQIHDVERTISGDETALNNLNHRISFSSISLTIGSRQTPIATPAHHDSGGLTIGRAWHDAGRVLTVAAAVGLIALAGLVPVALLAALAWWAGARVAQRRRERALDLA